MPEDHLSFWLAKFEDGSVRPGWDYWAWTKDQTSECKATGTRDAALYGDQPHAANVKVVMPPVNYRKRQ